MVSEKNATMTDQDEDEGLDEDQEDQEDLEDEDFEESEESGESEDEGEGDDSSSSSADEAPPAPPVATPPKGRKGGVKGKSASSKPDPAPVLALAKDDGKSKSTSTSKAKDNGKSGVKDNGKSTSKAKGKPSTSPKPTATALDKSRIRRIAQIMHLVTDETRLTILNLLMVEGELNVGDLCNRVEQTQPAVSHHLALLRVSGIIEPDRRGKHNFYMLTEDGHRLTKIFEYVG